MLQPKRKQFNFGTRRRINIRKEFRVQSRLRVSFERKFRNQLNKFFKTLFNNYADNYEVQLPVAPVFSEAINELYKLMNNHYRIVIEEFGLRIFNQLQKQEGQFEQIYQDYVRENGATKVVGIVETTRRYINKIIALNTDEFMGVALIAKDIRRLDRMAFSRYRSATIARTETHNAASFANQKVAQSMNIPQMQKQWLATNDDRTRGIHSAVSGTQLPMDEDFVVGGLPMAYPGDPKGGAKNVINCRCVLLYITPEDVLI